MPFGRFPGADSVLGPEMKSTGEVMGVAADFPAAYAKSQLAIDYSLPTIGHRVRLGVRPRQAPDRLAVPSTCRCSASRSCRRAGTAKALRAAGIPVTEVLKKHEGRPNIIDHIANGEVQLVINTPFGQETRSRRLPHPRGGDPPRHHQHHHAARRRGDRAGDRGDQGGPARRVRAAGLRAATRRRAPRRPRRGAR